MSEKKRVCPMKAIDFDHLMKKEDYFGTAIRVVDCLGLRRLMDTESNYNVTMIQQFYATVVFDKDINIGMTWMSDTHMLTSNFREFAAILGYRFSGSMLDEGTRMHLTGSSYDKAQLKDLYSDESKVGTTHGLLPLYDILLRMFRESIAPSAGNNDAIRGGLVNLLHFAHETATQGTLRPNANPVDVMDYIFNEMYDSMINKKVPPYAPYVMKLMKAKYPFSNDVTDPDVELPVRLMGGSK